jgi:hypothetical protein
MGFEPTRAEPIGLAVQRLNHSATSSLISESNLFENKETFTKKRAKLFPRRELNPGLLGESQLS